MDVVIVKCGPNKLNVVKLIREYTGLGNMEAMAFVNQLPKPLREGINKEEAELIKKALEGTGAEVKIIGIVNEDVSAPHNSGYIDINESKEKFDDFE